MSKGIDFCSHYLILHYYKHSKLFYIFLLTFFLLATLSQFTVIQYLQNILWASNNYRGQSYLGRRKPKERKMKKLFFLIVRTQLFGSNITAAMPVYFCLWLSDPIYSFNSYLVISCNIGMALQYISTIFYGCNTQKKKKTSIIEKLSMHHVPVLKKMLRYLPTYLRPTGSIPTSQKEIQPLWDQTSNKHSAKPQSFLMHSIICST